MNSFSQVFGIMVAGVVFAGCQGGTKFQVGDQRVPEQIGMRAESIGDFGREGVLANQSANLPRAYLETGELGFRLLRLTNSSDETIEFYPSVDHPRDSATATLIQDFYGACSREARTCSIKMEGPTAPSADLISEYVSEFDLLGSEFRFDSGGREAVVFDPGVDGPRPIRIRAGESATWVIRLGLRRGSPVILSAPPGLDRGASGLFFTPSGLASDADSRIWRDERLLGIRLEFHLRFSLLALDPKTDALNPVYLGPGKAAFTLYDEGAREVRAAYPPPKVARRIMGLAEQI